MSRLRVPVTERDHVRGSLRKASVVLVEYGDYECPYCAAAQPMVDALGAAMGETLATVFRHFPLVQVHARAERAAEAAEAAATQDAFWPMHELLFRQQPLFDDASLAAYAQALGLDVERFVEDLLASAYAARVQEDFMSGVRSGVNGTPSFFINGSRYDGAYELTSLLGAVQGAARLARKASAGPRARSPR